MKLFTNSVTIHRFGVSKLTPITRSKFGCRIYVSVDSSIRKFSSSFLVVLYSLLNCLMATSEPRHLPLKTIHELPLLICSSKVSSYVRIMGMPTEFLDMYCSM